MNTEEQLKKDISDFVSLVRLQNLYTLHYFFDDDVEDFYKNTSRYVAITENKTQVDKRYFNQVISKMRATNRYCSIGRNDLGNLFNHPRQNIRFNYKQQLDKLVEQKELLIFSHGSLHTKAMDKAEHFANKYFVPKFDLQNFVANYDSVEDAFKEAKEQASKRVLARFEKLVGTEDTVLEELDKALNHLKKAHKMKITKAQETAIQRRLELIDKFTTEIKGLFEGKTPEEVSTFSDAELDNMEHKRDALCNPKKVAAPKKSEVVFYNEMPKTEVVEEPKEKPSNQWIADLKKKLNELAPKVEPTSEMLDFDKLRELDRLMYPFRKRVFDKANPISEEELKTKEQEFRRELGL